MFIVIVLNVLDKAINEKLNAAFLVYPEAEKDKDIFYHKLLKYFDEYGEIPEFELKKKEI